MKCIAVIPARYGSKRLPGKPLLLLGSKPLVQHLYERVVSVPRIHRVLVATDDDRVFRCVNEFGGEAIMTSEDHRSGSDRVAEAVVTDTSPWVLNVQGDQPFLDPSTLDTLLDHALDNPRFPAHTPATLIHSPEELSNPSVVKVVADRDGRAVYFSRFPIPYHRDILKNGPIEIHSEKASKITQNFDYLRHIGVYLYRKEFLKEYTRWSSGPLELTEQLEQLRILENGYFLSVVKVKEAPLTVDTPEDYTLARELANSVHEVNQTVSTLNYRTDCINRLDNGLGLPKD